MPNHTDNRVILSHDDSQQIDMIYNIMNTENTPLCQTLIPMPKELEGTALAGTYGGCNTGEPSGIYTTHTSTAWMPTHLS